MKNNYVYLKSTIALAIGISLVSCGAIGVLVGPKEGKITPTERIKEQEVRSDSKDACGLAQKIQSDFWDNVSKNAIEEKKKLLFKINGEKSKTSSVVIDGTTCTSAPCAPAPLEQTSQADAERKEEVPLDMASLRNMGTLGEGCQGMTFQVTEGRESEGHFYVNKTSVSSICKSTTIVGVEAGEVVRKSIYQMVRECRGAEGVMKDKPVSFDISSSFSDNSKPEEERVYKSMSAKLDDILQ